MSKKRRINPKSVARSPLLLTAVVAVVIAAGFMANLPGFSSFRARAAAPFGIVFEPQQPLATSTPLPTNTPLATSTPRPASTNYPTPTVVGANETPVPTPTQLPTHTPEPTHTPLPTLTPNPTFTPLPTNTPIPDIMLAATKAAADCATVSLRCDITEGVNALGTPIVVLVFIPPASYVTPTPTAVP